MGELSGLRFGKIERAILLNAGANEPVAIPDDRLGRPLLPALSRARNKLARAGLIELKYVHSWQDPSVPPKPVRRRNPNDWSGREPFLEYEMYGTECRYLLTEFGVAVIAAYRSDLEAGRRVRWTRMPIALQDLLERRERERHEADAEKMRRALEIHQKIQSALRGRPPVDMDREWYVYAWGDWIARDEEKAAA